MIKKLTLTIVCLELLLGCAGTQPQTTFMDNTFTSDLPKLKVRVLKNVSKQKEESKQGQGFRMTRHSYLTDSGEIAGITIWRFVLDSNTEWRSSNEQLVRQTGAIPLDPIAINNKTWVKFVQLQKEYAAFGYFTRMDDNLVAVFSLIKAEQYKDDIESFAKTRVLSEQLIRLITKTFDGIEGLFVIDPYQPLDKDKSEKVVYTNFKIQFNELKNWKKLNPKFTNMIHFENPKNRSQIVIRAYSSGKTLNTNLEERADRWLTNLAEHFSWEKTEKKADGNTAIDGEESYWRRYSFVGKGKKYNGKVYFIQTEYFFYVFRFYNSMHNEAFDNSEKEFDAWANTIQFIR